MKYLLTSLNSTDSRAKAVKDYIKMGFSINPYEIRYGDKIPSIDKTIWANSIENRDLHLRESLDSLVQNISSNINSNVSVSGMTESGEDLLINLSVNNDKINVII